MRIRNLSVHLRVLLAPWFLALSLALSAGNVWALASNNIPLDSPIYASLQKLAGLGLIKSDMSGIRPYSRAEAARLLQEAMGNLATTSDPAGLSLAGEIVAYLKPLLARENSLRSQPEKAPAFDANPLSSLRMRYVYVDGVPRSYRRPVHDPAGEGVFGLGSGLRPSLAYPFPSNHRGTEGTPLMENNEGIRYRKGNNYEFRLSGEAFAGRYASALAEPLLLYSQGDQSSRLQLNKGYLKVGGEGLELEVGRDANWLGFGWRGNITLTDNAKNFDLVKLSSPEPINLKYIGALKYAVIFSRFDHTATSGFERQPFFLGAKLSVKPLTNVEAGLNLGRQVGGPGVNNSIGSMLRGMVGGTDVDNSNSLAGLELRVRLPFLRNTEVYGEFSGEDSAKFWPIVESYLAGLYIPMLTAGGRDDFRFEFFKGNNILYANNTFPEGYLYRGMPVGHSQGGAVIEFFSRYSHWFSVRNIVALEYIHTERGNSGRMTVDGNGDFLAGGVMQAVERKNAWRAFWDLPVYQDFDLGMMYGWERINNFNLVAGDSRVNQVLKLDLRYRY